MAPSRMGIYRLYRPPEGFSFLGFSRNLGAIEKRLRFELKLNTCPYRALQSFYNDCRGDMCFEVVEEYTPPADQTEVELDAHLMALLLKHKANTHNATLIQFPS